MTKQDLINEISKKNGIEQATVSKVVEAFMDSIKDSMVKGNDVFLRGFGSFTLVKRASKKARNISKNTTIIIPAHTVPTLKFAKVFKEKIKRNN